jgi:hypothetical protein
MTHEQIAARLNQIRDGCKAVPPDAWVLTEVMLQPPWLGNPDSALRDGLIYETLAGWIALARSWATSYEGSSPRSATRATSSTGLAIEATTPS